MVIQIHMCKKREENKKDDNKSKQLTKKKEKQKKKEKKTQGKMYDCFVLNKGKMFDGVKEKCFS